MDALVETVRLYYPGVLGIYWFGSRAAGVQGPGSDWDVAVLLSPQDSEAAGALGMSQCRFALERRLGADVDLVNLRRCHGVLQREILETGRLVFRTPGPDLGWFEMHALSRYQWLARERDPIIEALYGREVRDEG